MYSTWVIPVGSCKRFFIIKMQNTCGSFCAGHATVKWVNNIKKYIWLTVPALLQRQPRALQADMETKEKKERCPRVRLSILFIYYRQESWVVQKKERERREFAVKAVSNLNHFVINNKSQIIWEISALILKHFRISVTGTNDFQLFLSKALLLTEQIIWKVPDDLPL